MATKTETPGGEVTIYDPGLKQGNLDQMEIPPPPFAAPNLQAVTDVGAATSQPIVAASFQPSPSPVTGFVCPPGEGVIGRPDTFNPSTALRHMNGVAGNVDPLRAVWGTRERYSGVEPGGVVDDIAAVLVQATPISRSVAFGAAEGTPIEVRLGLANGDVVTLGTNGIPFTNCIRVVDVLPNAAIPAGTSLDVVIVAAGIGGIVVGSEVFVGGPPALAAGLILYAFVSAADQITLRISNVSALPANVAGEPFSVRIFTP